MKHIGKNYGVNSMGFLERLDKNIAKLEKRIEKEEMKIAHLEGKFNSKKITKAKLNIEKRKIYDRIKAMRSRVQTLKGITVKEKQHIEERAEEKEKKREEKEKKKKKKKKEED